METDEEAMKNDDWYLIYKVYLDWGLMTHKMSQLTTISSMPQLEPVV